MYEDMENSSYTRGVFFFYYKTGLQPFIRPCIYYKMTQKKTPGFPETVFWSGPKTA